MAALIILSLSAWLTQNDDLVQQFLQGKAGAGERLTGRGFAALPDLLEARATANGKAREALLDLVFEIKKATLDEADKDGRKVFAKIDATQVDLNFQVPTNADLIDLLRDLLGLNFVVDPESLDRLTGSLAVKAEGAVARSVLDQVCVAAGLDYDWRYGVLWIARPDRLWKRSPLLNEAQSKELRELLTELEKDSIRADKLRTDDKERRLTDAESKELRDLLRTNTERDTRVHNLVRRLGSSAFPLLEAFTSSKSPAVAELCTDLRKQIRMYKWAVSALPLHNVALMGLGGEKIRKMKIDFEQSECPFEGLMDFIREYSGLNIVDWTGRELEPVTLKANGVILADAFAMLTLPRGVDLDIRDGAVILIDPAKPRVPRVNRWKNQDLDDAGERAAERLESAKMNLDPPDKTPLRDLLGFLSEFHDIPISLEEGVPEPSIRLRVRDMALEHILAWITLPYGLDARIENGGIVVYERKKK